LRQHWLWAGLPPICLVAKKMQTIYGYHRPKRKRAVQGKERSVGPMGNRRGWYHGAIVDFAEQSLRALLKYFPPEKVRMKPGGSAGGVNPLAWGTYCPAYAKMAGPYRIVLQPADCQGAVFADKWMGTAYQSMRPEQDRSS